MCVCAHVGVYLFFSVTGIIIAVVIVIFVFVIINTAAASL